MSNETCQKTSVDCLHAAATSRPNVVTCSLGLFAGSPHVALCAQCSRRTPTEVSQPGRALDTIAVALPQPPTQPNVMRRSLINGIRPQNGHGTRLILRSHLSPGDIVMLTAAVRDLHRSHPGRFQTAVETSAPELWEHNPLISKIDHATEPWRAVDMQYPLVNQSNQRPVHFLQGYAEYLGQQLGLSIPITEFRGDVYLSEEEKHWTNQVEEQFGYRGRFWIILAGGKRDFTTKWWAPRSYQQVVDHFLGRIQFIQCGQADHWHPPLTGTLNLIGKTSIRQFIRLMYHADGVICPITFAMHLAAAVPRKEKRLRPCIVIAGGREPPHWEAYPGHHFLHTIGCLPCCEHGGCWKSRCQQVNDGDVKDRENLCERPVQVSADLKIPQCMMLVRPEDVIHSVERTLTYGVC